MSSLVTRKEVLGSHKVFVSDALLKSGLWTSSAVIRYQRKDKNVKLMLLVMKVLVVGTKEGAREGK